MKNLIKILLLSMIISISLIAQENQNVQKKISSYSNITEVGTYALITMSDGQLGMNIANISSWKQNRYTSLGFGIGFERDITKFIRDKDIQLMYIPIFADFRFSPNNNHFDPFFFISPGFSINLNDKIDYPYVDYDHKTVKKSTKLNNGICLSTGFGVQFKTVNNLAYHFSIGCDFKPRNHTITYDYVSHSENIIRQDMRVSLTLKAGLSL